jgi:hypothetical protein
MALLAGIALAKLGAAVVCTDLPGNLELLKKNCQCNGEGWQLRGAWLQQRCPLHSSANSRCMCDHLSSFDA